MIPTPQQAPSPSPVGAVPGAPQAAGSPPGGPPGGLQALLGNLGAQGPASAAAGDPNAAMKQAMSGIGMLADSIKQNPQMIEVLAAVMKTHPMLKMVFYAASRHPEVREKAAAGPAAQGPPPILGR